MWQYFSKFQFSLDCLLPNWISHLIGPLSSDRWVATRQSKRVITLIGVVFHYICNNSTMKKSGSICSIVKSRPRIGESFIKIEPSAERTWSDVSFARVWKHGIILSTIRDGFSTAQTAIAYIIPKLIILSTRAWMSYLWRCDRADFWFRVSQKADKAIAQSQVDTFGINDFREFCKSIGDRPSNPPRCISCDCNDNGKDLGRQNIGWNYFGQSNCAFYRVNSNGILLVLCELKE